MVKKSNSVLGFLRRNLRISNEKTKEAAYKTLARPHLYYCCTIWNPYTKELRNRVEMAQRQDTRFTTQRYRNTTSVSDMLEHLTGRPWSRVGLNQHLPCSIKWSMIWWTYRPQITSPLAAREPDPYSLKSRQYHCSTNSFKLAFFHQ
jgi:hypothetical protein